MARSSRLSHPCRIAAVVALLSTAQLTAPTVAAAGPDPAELQAQTLVEQVLAQNAGLAALRTAVDAAEARIVPAGALPDPELSAAFAPGTIGGFDTTDGQRDGSTNVRMEVSQSLPWPGTLDLRTAAARMEAAAAAEDAAALRLRLAAAIRSAFAQWRYTHAALAINSEHQALAADLRRVAERRYAAGVTTQQAVLQAEITQQQLRHQALQLERRERSVRARINALLNHPADASLDPPAALPAPAPVPSHAQLRDAALAAHPELGGIERRVAASENREALARKDFYPDFKLFAGYNSLRTPVDKRWIVGAGINLPLGREKYRARLDAANADTIQLEAELADRRAHLLGALEQARAAAVEARDSIELFEDELVPLARETLSATRDAYASGDSAFLDVIDAEEKLLEAELTLERLHADYFAARAELTRWAGGRLPQPAPTSMLTREPANDGAPANE